MNNNNKQSERELDEIDLILTKAFNDFYDYITEQDVIKAAHEYSEKTVYKKAKTAILTHLEAARREARVETAQDIKSKFIEYMLPEDESWFDDYIANLSDKQEQGE